MLTPNQNQSWIKFTTEKIALPARTAFHGRCLWPPSTSRDRSGPRPGPRRWPATAGERGRGRQGAQGKLQSVVKKKVFKES